MDGPEGDGDKESEETIENVKLFVFNSGEMLLLLTNV